MKLPLYLLLAAGLCGTLLAADEKPAPSAAQFKDNRDKVSYSLGANIASSMKMQNVDINVDEYIAGLRDGLAGKSKVSEAEIRETLTAWNRELQAKRMEKAKAEGERNKKAGDEWLAANARKPGVKTMPDGLQYKVLASGKGPQPKPSDIVSAHYKGTLTDGKEFDSSYTTGKPLTMPIQRLIPGWQEALTNMHVGDKWELYVPGHLAYGERGSPPKIGPNATLVFEMELLSIEPPQTNAAPGFPSLNAAPGGTPQIRVQPGQGASQPIKVQPAPGSTPQIKVQPAK